MEDSTAHVRVTICRSTDRTTASVSRTLDGERRHLVISVPWKQLPSETYTSVRSQLTDVEARALAHAFDLDGPQ